jgi:hypothetical protein
MLAALGAVAARVVGQKRNREKKTRAAQGDGDVPEVLALSPSDADDEFPLRASSRASPPASRGRGGRARKKRVRAAVEESDAELVTPPRRDEVDDAKPRSSLRDTAVRERADDAVMASFSHQQRNTIIFGMYSAAQRNLTSKGRERFSGRDINALLEQIRMATGEANLTWDGVQQRVARMREKETVARIPGSGRKSTFTPTIEESAVKVARAYGGEISRTHMFELVKADVGSPNMCAKSTFLEHLNKTFKRRRVRYRPRLTDGHRAKRIAFAKEALSAHPAKEQRIVFVDEKRFDVATTGTLTLPEGDLTPQRYIQSRTNPLFVMVLVGVMKPVGEFDGVVGRHAFVERVFAKRNSKNREAGTLELKPFNVSGDTYMQAWKESMFPALKKLIAKGLIDKPTVADPLFLQDDNAKPHRKMIDGKQVTELICEMGLRDFGIHIVPLDPPQPPQSPDTNPLDTFVFRMMNIRFRRLRAQSRVKELAAGLRNRPDAAEAEPESVHDEEFDDDEPQDEFIHRRRGVPLRCAVDGLTKNGAERKAKCRGCSRVVKETDVATICDLRNGWWHNSCAREVIADDPDLYKNAIDPAEVAADEPWVCPQCMYHLCRNDDRLRDVCVMCGKPSARSGDSMGTDMVSCDGRWEGLFHKSCARYDEAEEVREEHDTWFCPACDSLPVADGGNGGDDDEMEEIEQRPLHENSVNGLIGAIDAALEQLPRDAFERGFESRRVFFEKIVAAEGRNDYDLHFRAERKRKANEGRSGGRARRGKKRKN